MFIGTQLASQYGQAVLPPAPNGTARAVVSMLDQFGHMGQVPQLLRQHNVDVFVTARGLRAPRQAMLWRGTDGSVVLVAYIIGWYCNGKDLEDVVKGSQWPGPNRGRRAAPQSFVSMLQVRVVDTSVARLLRLRSHRLLIVCPLVFVCVYACVRLI